MRPRAVSLQLKDLRAISIRRSNGEGYTGGDLILIVAAIAMSFVTFARVKNARLAGESTREK
jgi:hypothetical protein